MGACYKPPALCECLLDTATALSCHRLRGAWRTCAWFTSEPDKIMVLQRGGDVGRAWLADLMH